MQLKALRSFSYSCDGIHLEQYEAGQIIDTEDEGMIRVATAEGWVEATAVNPEKPAKTPRRKTKE